MKFSLAKEQRDFFEKHGLLEIEGLISSSQLEVLNSCVLKFMRKEAALERRTLASVEPQNYFLAGRDLWRENPEIKKIIFHKCFSEIATELNFRAPFRAGSDQYIPQRFISNTKKSLNDGSSFQGIVFGYIICLKSDNLEVSKVTEIPEVIENFSSECLIDSDEPPHSPFSLIPGHVVFIHPDFPVNYSLLKQRAGCDYIFVTLIKDKSVYFYRESDAQTHYLKKLGYVFGDRIREETHPIVYRP